MNIAGDLDAAADVRGDHPALYFDGPDSPWSFGQLDLRASQIANALEASGLQAGNRVVIVMLNVPEHVAAWWGIAKAGMVPVDVNFVLGDEEWTYILRDAEPGAIICSAGFADRLLALAATLPRAPEMYVSGGGPDGTLSFDDLGTGTGRRSAVDRSDDDLAVIAYTSGTTGLPKGVMHRHGALRLHLDVVQETLEVTPDDVIAQCLPLFALHGFLSCGPGIGVHCGASVALLSRFDPKAFVDLSLEHPITTTLMTPSMVVGILQLAESERPELAHCRQLQCGGASLPPEVRDRFERAFDVPLLQGFGATELMGAVACERIGRRAPWGSCGELMPGAADFVRVVDDAGRELPLGEVGEFVVHRSRALMGYWRNEALTREAFIDDEWFMLGDIGRVDPDGFVYVLDRKKDMIIRGGFNIYSAEIERVLNEHEAVAEAIVIGISHERLGEVPKALLVLQTGAEASDELATSLRAYVVGRLGSLKAPEEFEFVGFGDLPRNPMGKVLKRELKGR